MAMPLLTDADRMFLYKQGKVSERARIINLIEYRCECAFDQDVSYYCDWHKLIDEINEVTNG